MVFEEIGNWIYRIVFYRFLFSDVFGFLVPELRIKMQSEDVPVIILSQCERQTSLALYLHVKNKH